jgi:uncharacterized cupin superfamily protein
MRVILHIKGAEAELDPEEQDELHIGSFDASYRILFRSSDGDFEAGLWDFSGEMSNPPQAAYEMVTVLIEGSTTLTSEGETFDIKAGDLFVYDPPTAELSFQSDGFRAAYIRRRVGEL